MLPIESKTNLQLLLHNLQVSKKKFNNWEQANAFFKIDLIKRYWQILVAEADKKSTAFIVCDGTYVILMVPFRMINLKVKLGCEISKILCGLDNINSYIGNLYLYKDDSKKHLQTLLKILFLRL